MYIFYIVYILFISVISTLSNHPLPLLPLLLLFPSPYSVPLSSCLIHGEHSRHLDLFLCCTLLLTLSLSLLTLTFTPSHQKRGHLLCLDPSFHLFAQLHHLPPLLRPFFMSKIFGVSLLTVTSLFCFFRKWKILGKNLFRSHNETFNILCL